MLWVEPVTGSSATASPGQKKRLTEALESLHIRAHGFHLLAVGQNHQIIARHAYLLRFAQSEPGQQFRRRLLNGGRRPGREIQSQPVAAARDAKLANKTGAKDNR